MSNPTPFVPQLTGRALLGLRVVWVGVVLLYLAGMLYGLPLLVQQYASLSGAALSIGFATWSSDGLRLALDALGISVRAYAVFSLFSVFSVPLAFVGMSLLLVVRRSHEWVGWFTSLFLATFGIVSSGAFQAIRAAYPHLGMLLDFVVGIPWLMFYVFFYIFPDGRFIPRWTRWMVVFLLGIVIITILLPTTEVLFPLFLVVAFGSAVFAQVYRYRRVATPTQRAQTRWVMYTVAVIAFLELFGQGMLRLAFPQLVVEGPTRLIYELWIIALNPLFAMIPLSLTIAILRYRLWDIDIIIRRTLIYTLLTAILVVVYIGSVVVLQTLLRPLVGIESELAIVASTLAIYALFQPLRRRIQNVIDRRFYRRKYDSRRVLESFAARLRQETDLDAMTHDMVAVVEETLQPVHASLWLRDDVNRRSSLQPPQP